MALHQLRTLAARRHVAVSVSCRATDGACAMSHAFASPARGLGTPMWVCARLHWAFVADGRGGATRRCTSAPLPRALGTCTALLCGRATDHCRTRCRALVTEDWSGATLNRACATLDGGCATVLWDLVTGGWTCIALHGASVTAAVPWACGTDDTS